MDETDRRENCGIGTNEGGPHRVHRMRMPVARSLQVLKPRRSGRTPRCRAALLAPGIPVGTPAALWLSLLAPRSSLLGPRPHEICCRLSAARGASSGEMKKNRPELLQSSV